MQQAQTEEEGDFDVIRYINGQQDFLLLTVLCRLSSFAPLSGILKHSLLFQCKKQQQKSSTL